MQALTKSLAVYPETFGSEILDCPLVFLKTYQLRPTAREWSKHDSISALTSTPLGINLYQKSR